METVTYTLPAFWATALFYDDTSSFDGYEDEKPFHDFCEYMLKEHGTSEPVDCTDEPHLVFWRVMFWITLLLLATAIRRRARW
jgi:hypothetical protein